FEDFALFERNVGQVKIARLIMSPAWSTVKQSDNVLQACARIRRHLGTLVDSHLGGGDGGFNDIATNVIAARDKETGEPFSREELIDQLGVFFMAGHETTASALIWTFYILATRADILERVRAEVSDIVGEGEITFDDVKRLPLIRSIFRETLRLYPPITFMPRVAVKAGQLGSLKFRRGALIMISPWTLHRHDAYWDNPNAFDPDRFLPEREAAIQPGTYIPFGLGPHTCIGAGFALAESALIIASLARRYDFHLKNADLMQPAARLTTRPRNEVFIQVKKRAA
ncbi:MAG: cytochrome P450, partial [Pseudomonadota bacterium]